MRKHRRTVAPDRPLIEIAGKDRGAFAIRLRDLVYSGWPIFALLRELRLKLTRLGSSRYPSRFDSWRHEGAVLTKGADLSAGTLRVMQTASGTMNDQIKAWHHLPMLDLRIRQASTSMALPERALLRLLSPLKYRT